MDRVLSIGASIEHIESINIAKSLGYEVVALDKNINAEGFKYADISLNIDIKNESKVIEQAKKYNIKAVIPAPIGKLLTTVGAVNDALKLNGITKEAALNCVDKVRFNECLSKFNIKCAKQLLANEKEEIINLVEEIGFPCILKPRFGSGSKGVIVVERKQDIKKCINKHLNERENDLTIIEELLAGKEYGIDGVMKNGEFKLILVREKVLTELPYRQEIQYICPANISNKLEEKIKETLYNACKATKVNNSLIHADVIINNNDIYIIEMSGRPAGYFISKKIIPAVTGVNFLYEGIKLSLDKESDFTNKKNNKDNILVLDFLDFLQGKTIKVPSNYELEKLDFIYESNIKFKSGDVIRKITSGKDIYDRGYIIIKAESFKDISSKKHMIKNIIENYND